MKLFLLLVAVALVAVAAAESDCQKKRKEAEDHETIMKLIPKCKDNGDYEALQCYKDSKFCVCYTKDGHPASPISSKIKECGCHLKRKEKIDRGHDNPFVPTCDETGKFVKKQCWDYNNSCWCVDENGDQVGEVSADESKLNC